MVEITVFAIAEILYFQIVWYLCIWALSSFQRTAWYITCWWFPVDRNRPNLDEGLVFGLRLAAMSLGNKHELDWVDVL